MEAQTKRFGIITGFTLMIVLLAINAIATRHQLADQVASHIWLEKSHQMLFELAETKLLLRNAESGQRGYLYTGDPKYLAPYQDSVHAILPHLDALARLTSDNPMQQKRAMMLRGLADAKISELARTISLFQSGQRDAARDLVDSDLGLVYMQNIDAVIQDMTKEEVSIQAARVEVYHKSIRKTAAAIYAASVIAALGLILLALYILREMALREKHAQQLLEREEWFRVTMTSLGDAVIATDNAGRVTYLNPLAEQLIGTTTLNSVGRPIEEVFPIFNEITHAPAENPIAKVIELGHIVGLANHTVLKTTSGGLVPIEDSAAPIRDREDRLIGVVLVFRDATRERKMQDVLRESEKLSAAARMSATVAHEINNPLEAMGNLLFLAKDTPGTPIEAIAYLKLAEQELERVSHITKRTLGFYRESRAPEHLEIRAVVEYVLNLLANKFKTKNITVHRDFTKCPLIVGVSGELKQVISNLIANAVDAVNENGTIWIRLSPVFQDGKPGVRIEVEDDGPGIPQEHADRIFEPFYTTKKDVGTGLGLWVSRGIIERHGGSIDLLPRNETQSRGAKFTISLPGGITELLGETNSNTGYSSAKPLNE